MAGDLSAAELGRNVERVEREIAELRGSSVDGKVWELQRAETGRRLGLVEAECARLDERLRSFMAEQEKRYRANVTLSLASFFLPLTVGLILVISKGLFGA